MDHFAFGFPVSKRRQVKSICRGTFPKFYAAFGPAIIDLGQRIRGKAWVELSENARLPTIDPYRKLVEAAGLGHCGIEISARNRRTTGVAVQILKDAKPREIPSSGGASVSQYREVARPSAPLEPLIFADEVIK